MACIVNVVGLQGTAFFSSSGCMVILGGSAVDRNTDLVQSSFEYFNKRCTQNVVLISVELYRVTAKGASLLLATKLLSRYAASIDTFTVDV